MATPTPNLYAGQGDGSVQTWTWTLTTADATGYGVSFPEYADITWTATGTWGGATLKVQGSDDNTTYVAAGLNGAAGGTEVSMTTNAIATTIERPLFVRPALTTSGVGATVTVTAVFRRGNPMRT